MNRNKKIVKKVTALYCRISLDDGNANESMSISNQKLLLKDYAEKNNMEIAYTYDDAGKSGVRVMTPTY